MSLAQPVKRYTPQEYYILERDADYKSEYYDGEIFAMSGGTTRHSRIVANLIGELHYRLKGKSCAPLELNQRLKVQDTGLRTYPDVAVYCGEMKYDLEDDQRETAINPTVLFEVLSPSTESYDRGTKSLNYRKIESLKTIVLVSQEMPHLELLDRRDDGTWLFKEEYGLDATIQLQAINIFLPLKEIYDRLEFDAATLRSPQPPPL